MLETGGIYPPPSNALYMHVKHRERIKLLKTTFYQFWRKFFRKPWSLTTLGTCFSKSEPFNEGKTFSETIQVDLLFKKKPLTYFNRICCEQIKKHCLFLVYTLSK